MSQHIPTISPNTILVPNPNFFLREEADEGGILFDANSGSVRLLNEPAAAIWKLIDGRRSLAEVIEALRKKFDSIDTGAEGEVLETARQFYQYGAVGLSEIK